MANESLRMTVLLPAQPDEVYRAWLDPAEHQAFTGSPATNERRVGGAHTAWGGYITGQNLELSPGERIVQSWRTAEFPAGSPDSKLVVTLRPLDGGTELLLEHVDIPDGQARGYEQGWVESYFEPLKKHFARRHRPLVLVPPLAPAPAAKKSKPVAKKSKPAAKKKSKPAAKKSKPAAKKSKPAAKKSKPAAKKSKPAAKKSKPAAKKSKPAAKKSKPAAKKKR